MEEFVKGDDLINLVLQFLKESNLNQTYRVLREETKIKTNFISNVEEFQENIISGRWQFVFKEVANLELPRETMMTLYETVLFELFELNEWDLAKHILKEIIPQKSKKNQKIRKLRIFG